LVVVGKEDCTTGGKRFGRVDEPRVEVLEDKLAPMGDYCIRFERDTNVESFTAVYEDLKRSLNVLLIERNLIRRFFVDWG